MENKEKERLFRAAVERAKRDLEHCMKNPTCECPTCTGKAHVIITKL